MEWEAMLAASSWLGTLLTVWMVDRVWQWWWDWRP